MNVHGSIIHSSQKVETTKGPSVDKQISKMGYMCTIDCYSVTKGNEVPVRAMTSTNLESMLLGEINHHKAVCHIIPFL